MSGRKGGWGGGCSPGLFIFDFTKSCALLHSPKIAFSGFKIKPHDGVSPSVIYILNLIRHMWKYETLYKSSCRLREKYHTKQRYTFFQPNLPEEPSFKLPSSHHALNASLQLVVPVNLKITIPPNHYTHYTTIIHVIHKMSFETFVT